MRNYNPLKALFHLNLKLNLKLNILLEKYIGKERAKEKFMQIKEEKWKLSLFIIHD